MGPVEPLGIKYYHIKVEEREPRRCFYATVKHGGV